MDKDCEIAYSYEDKTDDMILDYFTSRNYTITRREGLNRIDYDITHDGKDYLLEVKTRDAYSTDYPTAWIRQDKVEAMEQFSLTENKPCWLMYVYTLDNKFFLTDYQKLKEYWDKYGTVTRTVYNPIKQQVTEVNVQIPLHEQKFHALKTNTSKATKTNNRLE